MIEYKITGKQWKLRQLVSTLYKLHIPSDQFYEYGFILVSLRKDSREYQQMLEKCRELGLTFKKR